MSIFKKLTKYLIPLTVFVLCELLFLSPQWEIIDFQAYDVLINQRGERPVSDDICIVVIDEETQKTMEDIGLKWPYPRGLYGTLIHNLIDAGARKIIFDIEFPETMGDPKQDSLLAQAVANHKHKILLAGELRKEEYPSYTRNFLVPPFKALRENAAWGLVNIHIDSDNFIRNYLLYKDHEGQRYYTLGVLGTTAKQKPQEAEYLLRNIPRTWANTTLINFYGPPNQVFEHIPFWQTVDNHPLFQEDIFSINAFETILKPNGVFRDRIVLVGSTLETHKDYFMTPYSDAFMFGVEIHAHFIEMIRNGQYLYRVPYWFLVMIHLIATILLFLLFRRLNPWLALVVAAILLLVSWWTASYLFNAHNLVMPAFQTMLLIVLVYFGSLLFQWMMSNRERCKIRNVFSRYMAPHLVKELLNSPDSIQFGGIQRDITIMIVDIRNFTPYAETHSPAETVNILREIQTAMVDIITRNNGTLDKFLGDGLIALFGVPVQTPNHALDGCRAAIQIRQQLRSMVRRWVTEGRDPVEIGIGLNSGVTLVGNLGSEQIFDYTAIGDPVNVCSRLETLNKIFYTKHEIIISEETRNKAGDSISASFIDETYLKGRSEPVRVYELLDVKDLL